MALVSILVSLLLFVGANALETGMKAQARKGLTKLETNSAETSSEEASYALRGVSEGQRGAPCSCEASNTEWKPCTRKNAKCIFIDLGAADGNSFNVFLNHGYGNVSNCADQTGEWDAVLVEANPLFDKPLKAEAAKHPGSVTSMSSTAAYMCEGKTSFYIDTINTEQNYWGSSMSENHQDVKKSNGKRVTVPTMNLNRILYEQTIPSDYVIVKMDIEGAEWDVLPCLAQSSSSDLLDELFLEQHPSTWGNIGTTSKQMEQAKAQLVAKGVRIPNYFSQTF